MTDQIRVAVPAGWTRRRLLGTGVAGVSAALLAACGSDSKSSTAAAATTPASTTAAGAAGTTAGAGTTATSGATPPTGTVHVGMGWIKNVEYAGSWLALDKGFYADQGIEADYLQGGPNAPAPPVAVAAGDAQIGVVPSMTSLIDAIGQGNDFVVFATQYQTSPGAVLSMAKKPVTKPSDFDGITFLGQEGVDVTIDAVLKIAGLPKNYKFVVAGFTPDPLVEGQGDAYSCFLVNQPITLETQGLVQGKDFIVTTWADLGLPSYSNLFFAPRDYYEANRDVVKRFMTATIMGWEANEADPAVGAKLAVDTYGVDLGLDIKQQTRQNELQIPLMQSALTSSSGLMRLDAAQWDGPMREALVASGRTTMPSAADVLDLTFLDEVFGSKTRLTS
jgi:ABC-type nitrate/sulfonate/bicarbonate transport system substrate-binding protein